MTRFLLLVSLACALAAPGAFAQVARVIESRGVAMVERAGTALRILGAGEPLDQRDTIRVSRDSHAILEFNDQTRITLRPNTVFRLDAYRDSAPASMLFGLEKGGLRAVSGQYAKRNPGGVKINIALATIGIRGTDFDARLCEADCAYEERARPTPRLRVPPVARVVEMNGLAAASQAGEPGRFLVPGAALYEGDGVATGRNSYAVLVFRDGSRISLDAESGLAIAIFRYDETSNSGNAVIGHVSGVVRVQSGAIAKRSPDAYHFITPLGQVRLLGTLVESAIRKATEVVDAAGGAAQQGTEDAKKNAEEEKKKAEEEKRKAEAAKAEAEKKAAAAKAEAKKQAEAAAIEAKNKAAAAKANAEKKAAASKAGAEKFVQKRSSERGTAQTDLAAATEAAAADISKSAEDNAAAAKQKAAEGAAEAKKQAGAAVEQGQRRSERSTPAPPPVDPDAAAAAAGSIPFAGPALSLIVRLAPGAADTAKRKAEQGAEEVKKQAGEVRDPKEDRDESNALDQGNMADPTYMEATIARTKSKADDAAAEAEKKAAAAAAEAKKQGEAAVTQARSKADEAGGGRGGQIEQLLLMQGLQHQQQLLEEAQDVARKVHGTAGAIVRNMRAGGGGNPPPGAGDDGSTSGPQPFAESGAVSAMVAVWDGVVEVVHGRKVTRVRSGEMMRASGVFERAMVDSGATAPRPDLVKVDSNLFDGGTRAVEEGLYVWVREGEVSLEKDGRVLNVAAGNAAVARRDRIALLDYVPNFMRFDPVPRPGLPLNVALADAFRAPDGAAFGACKVR